VKLRERVRNAAFVIKLCLLPSVQNIRCQNQEIIVKEVFKNLHSLLPCLSDFV